MGWKQWFQKCHGNLELRVDGPEGPLIHWLDRGRGGQFTWSSGDPEDEIRDISSWTGDAAQIRLYAIVVEGGAPEDPFCEMITLNNETPCHRWHFDSDEDNDITMA